MSSPALYFDNIFDPPATLVDDPVGNPPAASRPKSNSVDWVQTTSWAASAAGLAGYNTSGGSLTCDYFLIAGGSPGMTAQLQYFNGIYINAHTIIQFSNPAEPFLLVRFASQTRSAFRVQCFNTPSVAQASIIMAGKAMEIPAPVRPPMTLPSLAQNGDTLNNETEGGLFAGRSIINNMINFKLGFDLLPDDFIRGVGAFATSPTFPEFLAHARLRPFGFCWEPTNHLDDAALVWTKGNGIKTIRTQTTYYSMDLDLNGRPQFEIPQ